MPIENRDLPVGTRLAAVYKKTRFVCVVEREEDGKIAFVLADGKRFKSPSSAASAVMGGSAANGWRFWSVEGEAPPAAAAMPTPKAAKEPKARKLIYRLPNQQGVPEGQTKFFCNACQKSFLGEGKEPPEQCPEGHRADDPELTAPVTPEAVTAE